LGCGNQQHQDGKRQDAEAHHANSAISGNGSTKPVFSFFALPTRGQTAHDVIRSNDSRS
jgi:hypothetical protein